MSSGRYWRRPWMINYFSLLVSFMLLVHVMYTQAVSLQIATLAKYAKGYGCWLVTLSQATLVKIMYVFMLCC